MMLSNFFLVATETTAGTGTDANQSGSIWGMLIIYALIFGAMYLILFRPQNKKRKQEEKLRQTAEIGDEIITIGGIVGRIVSIKEDTDTIVIETGADRIKIRIKRWAIGSNSTQEARAEEERATAAVGKKKGLLDKLNEKMEKKAREKEENK